LGGWLLLLRLRLRLRLRLGLCLWLRLRLWLWLRDLRLHLGLDLRLYSLLHLTLYVPQRWTLRLLRHLTLGDLVPRHAHSDPNPDLRSGTGTIPDRTLHRIRLRIRIRIRIDILPLLLPLLGVLGVPGCILLRLGVLGVSR
jgi:hypothetical protein